MPNSHRNKRYMAKWTCYFPRPWHGNKCLRTCNGKQLEAYCECGKAVRGAKVDSDCGWVGIVSFLPNSWTVNIRTLVQFQDKL